MLGETKGSIYMRSRSTRALVALVAACAMSAVAASAAFAAEPEFKPGTKQTFTGTSGAFAMGGEVTRISCSKDTVAGEVTGVSTIASLKMTFTGCTVKHDSAPSCYVSSKGAKEGEIVTESLKGELGEVAKAEATSGVGLLIAPTSGKVLAKVTADCDFPYEWEWFEGDIAGEVTPIYTSAKTLKLVFAEVFEKPQIKTITIKGKAIKPKLTLNDGLEIRAWGGTDGLEFTKALEVT